MSFFDKLLNLKYRLDLVNHNTELECTTEKSVILFHIYSVNIFIKDKNRLII
jgi:hypothetical protein